MKCARCHDEFACAGDQSCWCFSLSIIPKEVLEQFDGCLCRKCLTVVSENIRTEDDYCNLCGSYDCDGCDCPD